VLELRAGAGSSWTREGSPGPCENRLCLLLRLLEGSQEVNYGAHRFGIEKVLQRALPHPDRIHVPPALRDNAPQLLVRFCLYIRGIEPGNRNPEKGPLNLWVHLP